MRYMHTMLVLGMTFQEHQWFHLIEINVFLSVYDVSIYVMYPFNLNTHTCINNWFCTIPPSTLSVLREIPLSSAIALKTS